MATAIVLVGGEGCGKTSQMELLAEFASFLEIEMSDLIKEKSKVDPELDAAANEAAENGTYLSCEVIKPLFLEYMADVSPMENIVLGGCVRRESQAKYVLTHLQKMGYDVHVVYLFMDEEECKERIAERAKEAQRRGNKPRPRDLDPVAIQTSLNSFFEGITDILGYFESQSVPIHWVAAMLSKAEVFGQVCKEIGIALKTPVSV